MGNPVSTQHLVIGSGAGGAVTAALLAEAGQDVLVVEEGSDVPQGRWPRFSLDQLQAQYRGSGMTAMFGNGLVNYAEGSCLGGGTEVNSGLYHAPEAALLDEWSRRFSINDFTAASIAPFIARVERDLRVAPASGPITDGASLKLDQGAAELTWHCQEVPRWAHREADGQMVWHGMLATYLPRATAAGATVLTDCRIERLVLNGSRAVGAVASQADGTTLEISAEQVWVCAGAIQSAALLKQSGVRLRGGGLSAHPTVKATARFGESLGAPVDVPVHQVKEFAPDITLGGSARTASQVALSLADDWPSGSEFMEEVEAVGVYYAAGRPRTGGGAVLARGLPNAVPVLWIGRRERRLLASGLRRLCHLLLAAGAREIRVGIPGFGAIRTPAHVAALPSILPLSTALMTVHTFATLPMGEASGSCPADSYGRIAGYQALRANDASLIPSAPGINPQGTVMAIASRNVHQYLSESSP